MRPWAKITACALVTVASLGVAGIGWGGVRADTFEVKGLDIGAGSTSIESNTSFFHGFPHRADRLRASNELDLGYGVTDRWKIDGKLTLDRSLGGETQVSTLGLETTLVLRKHSNGFGLGWLAGVEAAVNRDETNTAAMGPIVVLGDDKLSFTVNPMIERTFGQNRERGATLGVAAKLQAEVREGFAVGLEGHGVVPEIGAGRGGGERELRLGPVVYFEHLLGKATARHDRDDGSGRAENREVKWSLEAGVLVGTTAATQDLTVKIKSGFSW
jgi:hypothetical protein